MQTEKTIHRMYELKPVTQGMSTKGGVFGKGRILIGRSESCDLIVNGEGISAIHAVMEILDNKAVIYDMNSTNGTYVNDDRVVVKEIHLGDHFRLANVEFEFKNYVLGASLPPVLDTLEPEHGQASVKVLQTSPSESSAPKSLPTSVPAEAMIAPALIYPLSADPKAEFSEYIFEDKQELYPIFKYEPAKLAVEVIILFKEQIFSVDYLPEGKGTYYITGLQTKKDDLEFPYLGKNDKFPFIDVVGGQATVHTLPGFSVFHLSDKKRGTGHQSVSVTLSDNDIVRLHNKDLQIFVRNVSAPPKVAHAPILKRDPDFRKYLLMFLICVVMISIGMNVVETPEDEKKEELAPERLAKILYKQPLVVSKNKAVEKTEKAPKVVQKAPTKVAVQKADPKVAKQPEVKKPDIVETKDQTKKPDIGEKTAPYKQVVKQGTEKPTPSNKIAGPIKSASTQKNIDKNKSPRAFSQVNSKSLGHVEVYKSADFKSSISSLVSKGGSLSGVQTKTVGIGGDLVGAGGGSGVSTGTGNIETAEIATNQGSLVGATTGILGSSKGAEGLSGKKAVYTAGIPGETVVLGSMDPDVIRRILLDHLPQFRFCYQKELEKTGAETSGVINLNFVIGASGYVSQAGIDGSSSLPTEVKKCVVGVLKGITFPEPMGGGTVEVKQPLNFYPKRL